MLVNKIKIVGRVLQHISVASVQAFPVHARVYSRRPSPFTHAYISKHMQYPESGSRTGKAWAYVSCEGRLRVYGCGFTERSPDHLSNAVHAKKRGRPGLKYHVRIVGGAIGKTLLLFPEARSPSHLIEELLASRIICTTYGLLSIWYAYNLCIWGRPRLVSPLE